MHSGTLQGSSSQPSPGTQWFTGYVYSCILLSCFPFRDGTAEECPPAGYFVRIIHVFPRRTFGVNLKGRVRRVRVHFVYRKGFGIHRFARTVLYGDGSKL